MKTFKDFLTENSNDALGVQLLLNESDLTEEQEDTINEVVKQILMEYENGNDLEFVMDKIMNEGILGSLLGGLSGFALGKTIGKVIAKVLGVKKGILYDLLTSRLVGAALGSSLGKRL